MAQHLKHSPPSTKSAPLKPKAALRKKFQLAVIRKCPKPTLKEVMKDLEIKDPRYPKREAKRLENELAHVEQPKRGPKSQYTDDVLGIALKICNENAVVTYMDLLRALKLLGYVQAQAQPKAFRKAFQAYLRRNGLQYSLSHSGLVFHMDDKVKRMRRLFCKKWLGKLQDETGGAVKLSDIWFMDVMTVLKNPHPKGRCMRLRLLIAIHAHACPARAEPTDCQAHACIHPCTPMHTELMATSHAPVLVQLSSMYPYT